MTRTTGQLGHALRPWLPALAVLLLAAVLVAAMPARADAVAAEAAADGAGGLGVPAAPAVEVPGAAQAQAEVAAQAEAPALPALPAPAAPGIPLDTSEGLAPAATLPLRTASGVVPGGTGARGSSLLARSSLSVAADSLAGAAEQPAVQAAAGAVAAMGVAAALGVRPLLALLPLYSRLERGELLNHPARREIMGIITREPGVNISDLHGRVDLGWGSLLYHLQRLEAQGFVVSHRAGRDRRFFLNQRGVQTRAEGISALRAGNARALAEVVTARPGCTQEELAQSLGLSKSVVSKYAKRLEDASLLQREVGRNCLRLFPTGELRELLHTLPRPAALPADRPAAEPAALEEAPVAAG